MFFLVCKPFILSVTFSTPRLQGHLRIDPGINPGAHQTFLFIEMNNRQIVKKENKETGLLSEHELTLDP